MNPRLVTVVVSVLLALGVAFAGEADLAALVNSVPDADRSPDGMHTGPDPETAQKAVDIILKGGKGTIIALVDMLKEPDKGEDYKAHYLLHAAATYARRPDGEEHRQVVTEALVSALEADRPTIIRKYILEELLWLGGTEPVPILTKLLLDPELYDFAARALEARKLAEPLRAALPKAKGRNAAALAQALGVLRDVEAVPALVEAAGDADAGVQLAAIEALGNIGDPRGIDAVLAAAKLEKHSYEEMKAAEAALRLGECLVAAGKKDDARRIYTTVAKQCEGKAGRHIRIACLRGLASAGGEDILAELLAALADPDLQVRTAAADIATSLPGGAMVDKWLGLLKTGKPEDRPGILFVLGAIGDAKALPTLLQAMDGQEPLLRREAMRAAAAVGGQQAAEALVARALGKAGDERETALDSLAKARGPEANAVVAAAVQKAADPALKAQLIDVLAARRAGDQMAVILAVAEDASPAVRIAAARAFGVVGGAREAEALAKMIKAAKEADERGAEEQALLAVGLRSRDQTAAVLAAALDGASADAAAAMLRVLGRVGTPKAAQALTACTESPDPKIKDEAIRALSNWSENNGMAEAADGLLQVAKTAQDPRHQAMAIRRYVDLARRRREPAAQVNACAEALKLAKRADEKRHILGALGDIKDDASAKLAAACLDDKEVAQEAAAAIVRIARELKNKTTEDVQAALAKVVEFCKDERTVKEAREYLLKQPAKDPLAP